MRNKASKNLKTEFDKEIKDIADYIVNYSVDSELAIETSYYVLIDSIACGLLALKNDSCKKLLGPTFNSKNISNGARVFGTNYSLDPIQAAWNTGCIIRWLDFNDTWLAAEWGHPSDNLGSILPLADYVSQQNVLRGKEPIKILDLYNFIIKSYEIQGVLALENSFNKVGLDHVLLVRISSTALSTYILGGDYDQICNAVSQAWIDGSSLRTYRHSPNTGSRKSWAAGDAASRALMLSWLTLRGEEGYPSAISTPKWGFSDVSFGGNSLIRKQPYQTYVMENILFKISFPAEFHAQTAVEAAITLHDDYKDRLDEIKTIEVETQESAIRIISKIGPLYNYADRDHCLQYMIAIGLIYGELKIEHYNDEIALNPIIDKLRDKMLIYENLRFSRDYLDPKKRSITNSIKIYFKDGTHSKKITVEYPIGHKKRREEGIPFLLKKFKNSVNDYYSKDQSKNILKHLLDNESIINMSIQEFMDLLVIK